MDTHLAEELLQQKQLYQSVFELAAVGIARVAPDGSWLEVNQRFCDIVGYDRDALLATGGFANITHPDDLEEDLGFVRELLAGERREYRMEKRYFHRDGRVVWVRLAVALVRDEQSQPSYFISIVEDVSALIALQEELRESQDRLQLLIAHAPAALAMLDRDMRYLAVSRRFLEVYCPLEPEIIGRSHYEVFPEIPERWRELHRRGLAGEVSSADEDYFLRADGRVQWMRWELRPWLTAAGEVGGIVLFLEDVTSRREDKARIEHLAYHDQVTGLPNRTFLRERLRQAMAACERQLAFGAVVFIDLDQFKHINDVHGHAIGDEVLREVALRLREQVREEDTVARFGGDEFVILLTELGTQRESAARSALTVAEKVRTALERPVRIGNHGYRATASLGISLFPRGLDDQGRDDVDDVIREADIAMYRAKEVGRNALMIFEQDMQTRVASRYALVGHLRDALDGEGLELHVQSQVDLLGRVIGAEALVRWRHPESGMVPPSVFIPLAEESGLIVPLGDWTLRAVCTLTVRLKAAGLAFRLAVNVSPRQFHDPAFPDRVRTILDETGADADRLTFEVTENLLVARADEAVERIRTLTALGIRFSIDDFGTGYSSLSYLKRLPLQELKVDRDFVGDLPHDANDAVMVRTIVAMARNLGLTVVAEGVETQAQLAFLTDLGCERYQGHFFHRPEPATSWLERVLTGACVSPAPAENTEAQATDFNHQP